jgi:hypothetical protein
MARKAARLVLADELAIYRNRSIEYPARPAKIEAGQLISGLVAGIDALVPDVILTEQQIDEGVEVAGTTVTAPLCATRQTDLERRNRSEIET